MPRRAAGPPGSPQAHPPGPWPVHRSILSDPPVLLVGVDDALNDRIAGLAQAAGVPLQTATDPASAGRAWMSAGLVLVGPDVVASARDRPPQRRAGVVVVVPSPAQPEVWRDAVEAGAEQVAVLPEADSWLLDRLVDAGSGARTAVVVGVVGARGGAGASTLATALAVTRAQHGGEPILIDVDCLGGGLDLVLGAEHDPGLRWPDLSAVRGRLQPGLLSRSLPSIDGVRLLSWGREDAADAGPQAVSCVLDAATRESDLVVLDLPRRFDSSSRTALQACRTVFLIVPAEVRAAAAAARVQAAVETQTADLRLVVRGPSPTGLTAESIADSLHLPLAAELRPEPGLAVALDRGIAPPVRARGSLALVCRRLSAELMVA